MGLLWYFEEEINMILNNMRKTISHFFFFIFIGYYSQAQIPQPALVGYWHNWNDGSATYILLDQVDSRYNIIDVSFAVPASGTDYQMEFIPDQVAPATLINQIQTVQSQGRKVIISMGGATAPISLDNISERDAFVSSMGVILDTYGFDGIDIDFEGSSLSVTGGTISTPADAKIINLIDAIKQIMQNYFATHNKKLILTMAPETAYVQGGMSAYGGLWGAYLPVIDALRDSLDLLHVQLYNSGSMFGIDGIIYSQGTADFIVAMTEAVIQGFNTAGGAFAGLPETKVAVGLPACSSAAGGGFTDTAVVSSAMNYLLGTGPQPGTYTLAQSGGYPLLGGMMTWSVNWDAVNTCGSVYEFADNFASIFSTTTITQEVSSSERSFTIYPNPSDNVFNFYMTSALSPNEIIYIYNSIGEEVFSVGANAIKQSIDTSTWPAGIYFAKCGVHVQKLVRH